MYLFYLAFYDLLLIHLLLLSIISWIREVIPVYLVTVYYQENFLHSGYLDLWCFMTTNKKVYEGLSPLKL